MSNARRVIAILGPTASGKSDLAVALARRFKGEVISADSRQVYRGLDLGSGKITKREMERIPHHLLDVASPKKIFTAARYRTLGRKAMLDILRRGKLPIVCGGTGHYIDALLYDYLIPEVKPDRNFRKKLERQSAERLFRELARLDPVRASSIDRHNKRRLVRALEIIRATGKPVPVIGPGKHAWRDLAVVKIGILRTPQELRKRIAVRLGERLKSGMVAEVRRLKRAGLGSARLESLGLEYRFVNRYLEGTISRDEMIRNITEESRRYAKRQMTWWKKDAEIVWVKNRTEAISAVRKFLERAEKRGRVPELM